jgi:hypothetical protein
MPSESDAIDIHQWIAHSAVSSGRGAVSLDAIRYKIRSLPEMGPSASCPCALAW